MGGRADDNPLEVGRRRSAFAWTADLLGSIQLSLHGTVAVSPRRNKGNDRGAKKDTGSPRRQLSDAARQKFAPSCLLCLLIS